MDDVLYPDFADNWDDAIFREAVLRKAAPGDSLLDLGAGAGILEQMNFREKVNRTTGVDLDPRVLDNPYLDEATVGAATAIPYPDAEFDAVIANNLLEHLEDPVEVFAEVARVLRPGGWFLAKTPNAWHYVAIISRCTPHSFHQRVNAWRGRDRADTFATHYRVNTARRIRTVAAAAGLTVRSIEHHEGRPEYLRFNPLTYGLGWAYERIIGRIRCLRRFRVVLIIELQKPPAGHGAADSPGEIYPRLTIGPLST